MFGHVMNPTKRIRFRVRIHVTSSRTQESLHRKYQVQVRPNSPPSKPSPQKISPMITTSGMALSASCDATERTSRRILLAINDRSGTRSVIALVRLLNSSAELDVIFDHARLLSAVDVIEVDTIVCAGDISSVPPDIKELGYDIE